MKNFICYSAFFLLLSLNIQAQIEELPDPEFYKISHGGFLNGTSDGKIKTIDLSQVNDNFNNNPNDKETSRYVCAVNGWDSNNVKARLLGVLNIGEYGYLYFYTVINPKALPVKQVHYGVRLLDKQGKFKAYKLGSSQKPMLYGQNDDDSYNPTKSLLIKVNKVGKKTSFIVTNISELTKFETTYTLSLDKVGVNDNWISPFTKQLK